MPLPIAARAVKSEREGGREMSSRVLSSGLSGASASAARRVRRASAAGLTEEDGRAGLSPDKGNVASLTSMVDTLDPPLTQDEFDLLRKFAFEHAGIRIASYKKNMVRRRISKRLKATGFNSHEAYCRFLMSPEGEAEYQSLINALTTNKTEFFREPHHFEHLANVAMPRVLSRKSRARGDKKIRIWSAGCSTGEEPYTIAMVVDRIAGRQQGWDIRILATDIDTEVLQTGRNAQYPTESIGSIPEKFRKQSIRPCRENSDVFELAPHIRSLITFNPLNLHGSWPMRGCFDIIFCRNVVIYFDKPTQKKLFGRFADILEDKSFLYCGHSESLFGLTTKFRGVGKSIYEKLT